MENEIKVGDYLRTNYGRIGKVTAITDDYVFTDVEANCIAFHDVNHFFKNTFDKVVKKHSPNIIDLIECGDYVNGKEVKHIADFEGIEKPIRKIIFVDETHLIPGETAEDKDIKTVVTKEMMESISYKV